MCVSKTKDERNTRTSDNRGVQFQIKKTITDDLNELSALHVSF